MSSPQGTFDLAATMDMLRSSGLELKDKVTPSELTDRLNAAARDHFWREWDPGPLDEADHWHWSVIDKSVSPSALRKRMRKIAGAGMRRPWPPSAGWARARLDTLLRYLGLGSDGQSLKHSGTEKAGAGGTERMAIRFYFRQAVQATERPARGYSPAPGQPSWEFERVSSALQTLVDWRQKNDVSDDAGREAARQVAEWAEWAERELVALISDKMDRHRPDYAWRGTISRLADVCEWASGNRPSNYEVKNQGGADFHPTMKFIHAAAARVRAPEPPLKIETIRYLWRQVAAARKKT